MYKEQELEEMAEFIADHPCRSSYELAVRLQNMGYHKTEEVRKEVIKEMMDYVLDKRHNSPLPDIELMKCFARKNGVEVGEQ